VALPVDVFAGQQNFSGASGLPRQNIVGLRTGIDFGPLVGLRGFYWRGVNDNFSRQQGVQAYGGEAQFSLNAGPGVNPFLIAGAGQIDFTDRYAASTAAGAPVPPPADQTALILGGGVKIPVGTRFQLTGAARNYLSAADRRTQDVAEASQLRSNWQFSVGMSFGVGGRGARRQVAAAPRRDTVFVERASGRLVREADVAAADESAPATERVVVTERLAVTARGDTLRGAAADSALAADRTTRAVEVRSVAPAGRAGSYASDRTVQIVVPTEGEIIVRYGPQRGAAGAAPAGSPALRRPARSCVSCASATGASSASTARATARCRASSSTTAGARCANTASRRAASCASTSWCRRRAAARRSSPGPLRRRRSP
jgi:hypothetical protein